MLIVGVTALQAYVGAVVIGALLIAFYLGWMRYLLRGLQASDERLSLQDSMTSQARAHSVTGLWLLQIGALAFVALGMTGVERSRNIETFLEHVGLAAAFLMLAWPLAS